ncbi:hypothetical protein OG413_41245 [Streptomyces sp. NBC_01433]|uniref:hypothetical protein n=1 Tax=Streptomyces sp. NBC_01433 TaxID=2903864 RepID=UPI00225921B1|nr:hypothetical protein [Streptomyces sp. NBC_01433]MCX4681630.1 hypothetical protein [Streptomyces sp. NBC_01433]
MNPRNPKEPPGAETIGEGRPSLCDPTLLLIGRRLSGEEVWATIVAPDDQLFLTHMVADPPRPGRAHG